MTLRRRLRLVLPLAALVALFALLPVASASAANPTASLTIAGSGSGKVVGVGATPGNPAINCEYASPGPQTGTCAAETQAAGPFKAVKLRHEAAPGSTFVEWKIEQGVHNETYCAEESAGAGDCSAIAVGAEEVKVKAVFEATGSTLAITPKGSGTGQVDCEVNGSETDEPCTSTYPEGTELKLTAVPGVGSEFANFENASGSAETPCTGAPTSCAFTIEEETAIDAVFNLELEELTFNEGGPGSLAVACEEGSGFTACVKPLSELDYGTEVEVTANPDTGAETTVFEGTGSAGGCESEGSPCTFTITEDSSVTAEFELEAFEFEVNEGGPGSLEVLCEEGSGFTACVKPLSELDYGTEVEVTVNPDTGAETTVFEGTGSAGGCESEGSPCTFTITEDSSVTAEFELESKSLTISEPGSGSGAVECEDDGSPASCAGSFLYGHTIKIEASAAGGSELTALSGDSGSAVGSCSEETATTGSCEFAITEDSKITVAFEVEAGLVSFQKHITGTGSGEIKCDGGTCESSYTEGETVELEALPTGGHSHSLFKGWTVSGSGSVSTPCTGTTNPCEVKLQAPGPLSATAEFGAIAISGVSPGEGPISGGQPVTISGENLGGASEVKFGASAISCPSAGCAVESSSEIKVETPSHVAGTADVVVETPAGSSEGGTGAYTYVAAPTISSVSPDEGPAAGGQTVTIEGTGLANVSAVKFGGSVGGGLVEVSATKIEVETPSHAAGTVDVELTTPGGTATSTNAYAYFAAPTISSVSPDEGPAAGGQTVTIEGTGLANVSAVKFGGSVGGGLVEVSATKIEVETPSHAAGTVDVELTTPGGTATSTNAYAYLAAPTVTGVVPDEGPIAGGNAVAIEGTGLGGATKVEFGAAAVSAGEFLSNTATSIEVEAPAHAEGTVDVTVTTVGGASATGAADHYTYLTPEKSLTIEEGGSGSGSFECDAGSGPGACQGSYPTGTTLTVIAVPVAGSDFAAWSGECDSVSGNRCEATLDADKAVEATFTLQDHALTVSKGGTGTGTVTSSPAGIDCGGSCSHSYLHGASVTLSESPGAISDFAGWSGCDQVIAGQCKVTLSAARTVTATFTVRTHALTIEEVGPGSGSVSCDGGPCAGSYPEGTTVTLRATADPGSSFFGWAAAGCTAGGDCVVTLDRDTTVAASFEANPPASLSAPGTAIAAGTARVRGGRALLRLSCRGGGPCSGTAKLFAKLPVAGRRGKKAKNSARRRRRARLVLIGRVRFSLAAGESETLKAKIANGRARKLLAMGRALRAKLEGSGLQTRTVKLEGSGKRKRHTHHHRRGRRDQADHR